MHVDVEKLYTRYDLEMFSGGDTKMTVRFHMSSLNSTCIDWLTETCVAVKHIFISLLSSRASFVPLGLTCSIVRCSYE